MGESAPVNAERKGDQEAAAKKLEEMKGKAEHHHKSPNFFQEHTRKVFEPKTEKSVPKDILKRVKSAALLGVGAGVAVEGAAAFMLMEGTAGLGTINAFSTAIVGHPVIPATAIKGTAFIAGKFLAPFGLALGSPWIIANILEAINKFVGGSKISLGGGGGGSHGGGGGGSGH